MAINYVNLTKLIVLIGLITVAVYFSFIYLFPFLVAIVIAILIQPLVHLLNKKMRINRRIAVLITILFVLFSFITLITFSVIEFIHLLQYLMQHLPGSIEYILSKGEEIVTRFIDSIYHFVSQYFHSISPESYAMVQAMLTDMTNGLIDFSKNTLLSLLQDTVSWLTHLLSNSYYLIFILIGTFFFSSDGPKWFNYVLNRFPDSYRQFYDRTKKEFISLVKKYLLAQLFMIGLTGLIVYVGLTIIDMTYAFGIALTVMLFDLVPVVGISAIFIPWVFYLFFTGQYALTIEISILYLFLVIIRNLLEPKLIGSSIGVHPLLLLIILFVFIKLFGLIGFVLGPAAAVSLSVLKKVGTLRIIKDYIFR